MLSPRRALVLATASVASLAVAGLARIVRGYVTPVTEGQERVALLRELRPGLG